MLDNYIYFYCLYKLISFKINGVNEMEEFDDLDPWQDHEDRLENDEITDYEQCFMDGWQRSEP